MRLIGDFTEEKEAYFFYTFLSKKGIQSSYEPFSDAETKKRMWHVWVYEEDKVQEAYGDYLKYKANPQDPQFEIKEIIPPPPPPPAIGALSREEVEKELPRFHVKIQIHPRKPVPHPLINFFILICVVLFFWNGAQENRIAKTKGPLGVQLLLTPLQQQLLFDYPLAKEKVDGYLRDYPLDKYKDLKDLPEDAKNELKSQGDVCTWNGLYYFLFHFPKEGFAAIASIPMFEKIKQGEVWRLFTPTLLHRDFLHILFNMAWLWILGKQIEERTGKLRLLFLVLLLSFITNLFQYLVSGPYFLGFSGVVVGMAGFIWMRQKLAPWEGYPLNRATLIFILIFVAAMFLMEVISTLMQIFGVIEVSAGIANTAHIVGGLSGMLLARIPIFSKEIAK